MSGWTFLGLENPSAAAKFIEVNEMVEKMATFFHFALVKLTLPCVLLPNFIMSYFSYFTTDLGADAFILPLPVWLVWKWWFFKEETLLSIKLENFLKQLFHLFSRHRQPFDWRSPFGFFIAFSIQSASSYCITISAVCHMNILIGSCVLLLTITKDLKNEFKSTAELNETKMNRTELYKKMSNLIEFHTDTIELSEIIKTCLKSIDQDWNCQLFLNSRLNSSIKISFFVSSLAQKLANFYEFMITSVFLWGISSISSMLLTVKMEIVKCFSDNLTIEISSNVIEILSISAKRFGTSDGIDSTVGNNFLVIFWHFLVLRIRWECIESIWWD